MVQPHGVRGGPAIQHITFIRALEASGRFACHAVIPLDHEMRSEYVEAATSVHELPAMRTLPRVRTARGVARIGQHTAQEALGILRRARTVRAELIHTFNEAYPPGPLAATLLRIPSVVHVEGMTFLTPPSVARVYVPVLDSLTDRWLCCQTTIRDELIRHRVRSEKLAVVYNSVDVPAIRSALGAERPPQLDPQRKHVGLVAGMDPRKGHLVFIRAAAHVCAKREDVDFHLIGSTRGNDEYHGRLLDEIEKLHLADRVRLEGAPDDIGPWLAHLDVYCNTSHTEALSIAMIEAMTLGRPVVATRVGGTPEAVADGETGLLARPDDPADVGEKILRVLEKPAFAQSLGREGARRAESRFSDVQNSATIRNVFEDLLK